jgi:glycosyltransferase involved in cell wall biosynthesis
LTAVLCNSNAFVDETVFRPIAGTERTYDAVYNGSMSPQKRRELACLVPHAAHIFRFVDTLSHAQSLSLLGTMRQLMPTHDFLNKVDDTKIEKLSREDVNQVLARSSTGLCLSAREGAMFASVEYLLAGVPVVSTPALGGRHLFGSPETWLTVADTPEAVRDGVAEMKARNLSTERTREITLVRLHDYRARLRQVVLDYTGGAVVLPADYSDELYRGMVNWIDGPTMVARLVSAC